MAIDAKYGRVTLEHGTIGEDEPVVVFRAQDVLLPKTLMYYHLFCLKAGSPKRHLDAIINALGKVTLWQDDNPTKTPSSASMGELAGLTPGPDLDAHDDETERKLIVRIQNEGLLRAGLTVTDVRTALDG